VRGRVINVDFDVRGGPRKGYKMNMEKQRNKLYNKEVLKEEQKKRVKKEKEK